MAGEAAHYTCGAVNAKEGNQWFPSLNLPSFGSPLLAALLWSKASRVRER